ncbi:response regulator [Pseudomonas stutzeri]|uniref:response regulator n=1 Tax=Stutzerimonas stutzeri TaxID=316 RepID=UPI001F517275|nr:response regulator [Stutzerimonas stutzeri]MCI0916644.1 response regulator [Stutzerimonas stutzeri]
MLVLVEDDLVIRRLMREVFELDGFNPIAFSNADDAWRFLQHDAHSVSLLVTDLRMPGALKGSDLIRLSRAYFIFPIVASSGFAHAEGFDRTLVDAFVPKPWSIDQLVGACRDALRARSFELARS